MEDKVYYKVLLVDDNKSLGASLLNQAERNGLDLRQYECWEEAKQMLINREDFSSWDAIILDARCVDKKGDPADLHFLGTALRDLSGLFERHSTQTPWYVLTAGGKEDFQFVMEGISRYPRDEKAWGKMLYFKDSPADENGKDDVDCLFENIQRVAPLKTTNQIKHLYREMFKAMDACLDGKGKGIMMEILTALHFPEYRKDFDPDKQYNRLRKIVESLFHSANKIGLLPDEYFKKGRPILQEASRYMAGENPKHIPMRHGEENEYIFPPIIASSVKNILDVTNTGSHIEVNQANLLFGYALQLCEVIVWFGDYAMNHSDIEKNLSKCKRIELQNTDNVEIQAPEYEGKSFLLEQDEKGTLHAGFCLVHKKHQEKLGEMVILRNVVKNTDKATRNLYLYYANVVELDNQQT